MKSDAPNLYYAIRQQSYCMPPNDVLVWDRLMTHQGNGIRFFRQSVVGEHLVDLYCPQANVVADLDAPAIGDENAEYLIRLADIEKTGALVMRFSAGRYARCPDKICQALLAECSKRILGRNLI